MQNAFAIIIAGAVFAILLLFISVAKMFRKAAPNQAIIVYGFRKPRVIKSGAAIIFPVVETYRELTLELMSFDVAPQQDPLHQAGRSGYGRSRRADQGSFRRRVHPHGCGTVFV